MEKTLFSRHVLFSSLDHDDVKAILDDIALFNRIKRTAARRESGPSAGRPGSTPDLRKKENREMRDSLPESMHVQLKKAFGTDDYFTNSAIRAANASIRSARELKQMNIDKASSDLKDVKAKIRSEKRRLKTLAGIRKSLVKRSKARQAGKSIPVPCSNAIETYRDGKWTIATFGKAVGTYGNDYLFEVRYLRPKIRQLEGTVRYLSLRQDRLEHRISRMKADDKAHICYGSKDLFRKQETVYKDHHDVWQSVFRRRRNRGLTISGRKDAAGGNFLFRYDQFAGTLYYRSQSKHGVIAIPGVVFPYGQADVNRTVTAGKETRQAVAWSIEIHGQSFLIKCTVQAVSDCRINDDYSLGCIAVDSNYDCLAVTETDRYGNLLHHMIIPVDVTGCSGYNEQSVSKALDRVFNLCVKIHKPFAMEDLSMKSKPSRYGGKKRNRHTVLFSPEKITWLAESKALRAGVACIFVNPAYTSQIGKMKYLRRYGLSVHESASLVIARRAMGLRHERLPEWMRKDPAVQSILRGSKTACRNVWKAVYPLTKKIRPRDRIAVIAPSFA